MINSEEASSLFLEKIISRCYTNIVDNILDNVEDIRTIKNPPRGIIEFHTWYVTLSYEEKESIKYILKETLYQSIFSFLVVLDNMSPGMPLGEIVSDYAIYIQAYKDTQTMTDNKPIESVKINNWRKGDIMLHDKFGEIISKY